ncbi:hypothetical protein [Acinetobacter sp. LoGeW2-3]|uniref:hypothetical protein n=1 Tax=Acinetobacter sp. LoGeW2-3 TaxID=1808001 RepID=UPI00148A74CC|nr:hypothetical protein [Acinetobacter sp. LoGeW2-3]
MDTQEEWATEAYLNNDETGVLTMLQLLKKIFCLHIYEYQHMEEIGTHRECRKCGVNKD